MAIAHTRAPVARRARRPPRQRRRCARSANFGFLVPESCPEVPADVLDPRGTWSDKKAYDETARGLTQRFEANFREYEPFVGSEIKEVAIRAAA